MFLKVFTLASILSVNLDKLFNKHGVMFGFCVVEVWILSCYGVIFVAYDKGVLRGACLHFVLVLVLLFSVASSIGFYGPEVLFPLSLRFLSLVRSIFEIVDITDGDA